jgi:hypothetical protein
VKDGNLTLVLVPLFNGSQFEIDHPLFDPHDFVDQWLSQRPKFNFHYRFDGMFKADPNDTRIVQVLFHRKIQKNWTNLNQALQ